MRLRLPCPSPASRLLRQLGGDRRGAVIIEFAICATAFFGLLIACLVTALVMFAQQCIQTTADTMARKVLTGQAQMAGLTAEQFRQQACATLPAFLQCGKLMVDLTRAASFSAADLGAPVITRDNKGKITNNWRFDNAASGDVVVLRVMYIWPVPAAPGFTLANAGSGQRLLIGTQVFKAEAYS